MSNYIIHIIRNYGRNNEVIEGFSFYNTKGHIISPFAGSLQNVFHTKEYVLIIEIIYVLEKWEDTDWKIDLKSFDNFLRYAKNKIVSHKSFKGKKRDIDLKEFNTETVEAIIYFKDWVTEEFDEKFSYENIIRKIFRDIYIQWRKEDYSIEKFL